MDELSRTILDEVAALEQQMAPENCYRLADEAVTALEQAQAAAMAHNTPETRAALVKAHARAHALLMVLTPEMIKADFVKFSLLEAALARLDATPPWEDPLLDPDDLRVNPPKA